MATLTMADLLAKEEDEQGSFSKRLLKLERNQQISGEVIQISDSEVILDLGSKAEGVLPKKDLPGNEPGIGDKITAFVVRTENESGQVVLALNKLTPSGRGRGKNWDKFISAKSRGQLFRSKATELNRGGLVVEIEGTRGFLPSSQISLSQAAKIEEMVGQELQVIVIEVEPGQNRLILSQRVQVSEDLKKKLSSLKAGNKIKGQVEAILPFGVFAKFEDNLEGLAHISELAWEKVEDPGSLFKIGDEIEGIITSVDLNAGRINFSVKQGSADPFSEKVKDIAPEDVVTGTVTKVASQGVTLELEGGLEGFIPGNKMGSEADYPTGKKVTCLVDSIDTQKRRISLVPFVTSTKDLIYK